MIFGDLVALTKDMEREAPIREIPMQPEDAEYVANVREGQVPTTHRRVWPAAQNLLDWLVRNADRVGLSRQVRGTRVSHGLRQL